MRYFNDNKRYIIGNEDPSTSGLALTGSWELIDSESNPTSIIDAEQRSWVTILGSVSHQNKGIPKSKIPFFLVGESLDATGYSGQIGSATKISLLPEAQISADLQYEVAIEIPPNTLQPGKYNIQLIAALEENGHMLDVLSESEPINIEVVASE